MSNWGTIPDWVAAIGTVGAFCVTIRLLARELADARGRREQDLRDQARLVFAWVDGVGSNHIPAPSHLDYRSSFQVRNGSREPIYDLVVLVRSRPIGWLLAFEKLLEVGLVPPDYQRSFQVLLGEAEYRPHEVPPVLDRRTDMSLELSFRDARGLSWRRQANGILTRVTNDRNE